MFATSVQYRDLSAFICHLLFVAYDLVIASLHPVNSYSVVRILKVQDLY